MKLLQAGHRVALVDRSGDALSEALAGLDADRAMPLCLDIASPDSPAALDAAIRVRWEPASVLVNNAAISPKHAGKAADLEQVTAEEWRLVMEINVAAPMRLAACLIPFMRQQGWGRIINVSSRAGRSIANAAGPAYMTSKAAVLGITRSIASDYAQYGVTCNSVAPGLVETALTRAISPDLLATIRARTALGRGGEPEEIGAVIAFLASHDAGFITGACIAVNGGAFMC
ncbi:SDR family oxidoreductase [Paraburkholderia caribensis]|uniref:SDR family NAD(P)-dependent oxidoreductase n=1 Tax=Paraburkholderia caribensis TaxID=75105 RepID=UPI0013148740